MKQVITNSAKELRAVLERLNKGDPNLATARVIGKCFDTKVGAPKFYMVLFILGDLAHNLHLQVKSSDQMFFTDDLKTKCISAIHGILNAFTLPKLNSTWQATRDECVKPEYLAYVDAADMGISEEFSFRKLSTDDINTIKEEVDAIRRSMGDIDPNLIKTIETVLAVIEEMFVINDLVADPNTLAERIIVANAMVDAVDRDDVGIYTKQIIGRVRRVVYTIASVLAMGVGVYVGIPEMGRATREYWKPKYLGAIEAILPKNPNTLRLPSDDEDRKALRRPTALWKTSAIRATNALSLSGRGGDQGGTDAGGRSVVGWDGVAAWPREVDQPGVRGTHT